MKQSVSVQAVASQSLALNRPSFGPQVDCVWDACVFLRASLGRARTHARRSLIEHMVTAQHLHPAVRRCLLGWRVRNAPVGSVYVFTSIRTEDSSSRDSQLWRGGGGCFPPSWPRVRGQLGWLLTQAHAKGEILNYMDYK